MRAVVLVVSDVLGQYLLEVSAPEDEEPIKLADRGLDPVVAGAIGGKGPIVAAWEERQGSEEQVRVAVIAPAK